MKNLIASLLSAFGGRAAQTADPNQILFSLPTIAADPAPLDPQAATPAAGDLVLHEDDWAQVEFLPKARAGEVQRLLTEYKAFEIANRAKSGWRNIYARKLARTPVVAGADARAHLEQILGVKAAPAPVIAIGREGGARVAHGFTLPLGGNVDLYGYTDDAGVPVLGASIRANADDTKLTTAFAKLAASDALILVDWRQQLLLTGTAANGHLEVWRP